MFSLGEAKYSKKITRITWGITSVIIMTVTSYFYIYKDLTALARFDVFMWIVTCLFLKLLFQDSMMKWLFNAVTVFNVGLFILVVSYAFSRILPYPMYANTVIRIILYLLFMMIFKKYVYPLYRQVVDRWHQFLFVSLAITLNFVYILLSTTDIAQAISQNLRLLLLLSGLMFFVYSTIFWSLGSIIREYEFSNAKEQARLHENLLYSQLAAHEEFIEISKHHRHDLRHHNQIMMEYLKDGDHQGIWEYLELYDQNLTEKAMKKYCNNYIANALLGLYSQKAEEAKIAFSAKADVPENLAIASPELGSLLSNILENGLEACQKVKENQGFITFIAEIEEDTLKIELKNSVKGMVEFRTNLPVSTKEGGGTGTKSILRIVEHYCGMVHFRQEGHTFITQIILPL